MDVTQKTATSGIQLREGGMGIGADYPNPVPPLCGVDSGQER